MQYRTVVVLAIHVLLTVSDITALQNAKSLNPHTSGLLLFNGPAIYAPSAEIYRHGAVGLSFCRRQCGCTGLFSFTVWKAGSEGRIIIVKIVNYSRSRSFKVIETGTSRQPVCDFLLVGLGNSNLVIVSEIVNKSVNQSIIILLKFARTVYTVSRTARLTMALTAALIIVTETP